MVTYEQLLVSDLEWALMEGSLHFENKSWVHKTLRKVARRLEELQVPYALVGDMAMFFHGYRRFTETVDLLVTRDGLDRFRNSSPVKNYRPIDERVMAFRDVELGVRVNFVLAGASAAFGGMSPVTFPQPENAADQIDGLRVLPVLNLLELKLAWGMSSVRRIGDLGDIQELIRRLQLTKEICNHLHPSVQHKYDELWEAAQVPDPISDENPTGMEAGRCSIPRSTAL